MKTTTENNPPRCCKSTASNNHIEACKRYNYVYNYIC